MHIYSFRLWVVVLSVLVGGVQFSHAKGAIPTSECIAKEASFQGSIVSASLICRDEIGGPVYFASQFCRLPNAVPSSVGDSKSGPAILRIAMKTLDKDFWNRCRNSEQKISPEEEKAFKAESKFGLPKDQIDAIGSNWQAGTCNIHRPAATGPVPVVQGDCSIVGKQTELGCEAGGITYGTFYYDDRCDVRTDSNRCWARGRNPGSLTGPCVLGSLGRSNYKNGPAQVCRVGEGKLASEYSEYFTDSACSREKYTRNLLLPSPGQDAIIKRASRAKESDRTGAKPDSATAPVLPTLPPKPPARGVRTLEAN